MDVPIAHRVENNPLPLRTTTSRYELLDLALEHGVLPDPVLRAGSLYGAWWRERHESQGGVGAQQERLRELIARELLRRVAGWLEPDGAKAFVHVFSHRTLPYLVESVGGGAVLHRRVDAEP